MVKIEILVDLIARAAHMTRPPDKARLLDYLELYATAKNEQSQTDTAVKKSEAETPAITTIAEPNTDTSQNRKPDISEIAMPEAKTEAAEGIIEKAFSGSDGPEKRRIYIHLLRYRKEHGPYCSADIVAASNGALSVVEFHNMAAGAAGAAAPIAKWRVLEAALNCLNENGEK